MRHVLDVVMQNQGLFCALGALVVSEVLPFVKSSQWNGILQGLYTVLRKRGGGAQ